MDRIDSISELASQCLKVLGDKGRLKTALPGFHARHEQTKLASAIAHAITKQSILVAEAGTGTGKTFAYLIPCLLSGKKALISTATKTLQDQLFHKDLPMLAHALGLSLRVQNLKGRSSYLCRYRIQLHAEQGRFLTRKTVNDIVYVHEKLPQIKLGERGELPEIEEESPIWPYITSTADNCLGSECSFYQSCFLVKARKRALEADVVVINHHLFFADNRLKKEGFSELLPGVDVVVFDEAHQLAEIAANFFGQRLSTYQFRHLMDDILREWPALDLANQPLKQFSLDLDKVISDLFHIFPQAGERLHGQSLDNNKAYQTAYESLTKLARDSLACFAELDLSLSEYAGLLRCKTRLEDLLAFLECFASQRTQIRWVERLKQSLVLHLTPYDIATPFTELLNRQNNAWIFTSATLTVAASFEPFLKTLGLDETETLMLPSPFDFATQAMLYLPRTLPDPKDARYYDLLLERALPVINALGGRCFFLFTSHFALNHVAKRLHGHLKFPLLVQGQEAKPILLARFREFGNAVLLGTATFWEGVDVKGEALSCVIIDKLPFASPTDPVIRGKMAYLKQQGISGFDALSLPDAILALKQGVGRLIRDVSDKGVLMIADPRLTSREYGRQILQSLPAMRKTRDQQTVLEFIEQLKLSHESTCN